MLPINLLHNKGSKTYFRRKIICQKSDLYKEKKTIGEGISDNKIKSFVFFLFLIDLTDNSLLKIIIAIISSIICVFYVENIMKFTEKKKKTTLISDDSKWNTRLTYKIPSLYYISVVNKKNLKLKLQ